MPQFSFIPALWQSLVVLAVCVMLSDGTSVRRLKRFTSAAERLSAFRSAIISLWVAAGAALALAGPGQLFTVRATGEGLAWLADGTFARPVASVLLIVYFALALGPGLHCMLRPGARQKYSAAMRPLEYMLPVSAAERGWWIVLSISAGVCEEMFFRGLLPQFLHGQLHGGWSLNPGSAWLLACLVFGSCHAYQGTAGIVRTAVAGLMFSLLAILSGSLFVPIVLHALVDLALLWMYRPQLDRPSAAALLVAGTSAGRPPE